MKREIIREIPKVWGKEIWLVNRYDYCGKLLYVNKDACCSVHMHPIKTESFFLLSGIVSLEVEDERIILLPDSYAVTILPGQYHRYTGIEDSVILEISTHHEDSDTIRKEESRAAVRR